MLGRAQAIKRKNNLEIEKGKKVSNSFTVADMLNIASSISVVVPTVELDKQQIVQQILSSELERNINFNANCSVESCSDKADAVMPVVSVVKQPQDSARDGSSSSAVGKL